MIIVILLIFMASNLEVIVVSDVGDLNNVMDLVLCAGNWRVGTCPCMHNNNFAQLCVDEHII